MGHSPYPDRMARAYRELNRKGWDGMILCPGPDLAYLTGFEHGHAGERLLALVVRADEQSTWITPAMNASQVERNFPPGTPILRWTDAEGYVTALKRATDGLKRVLFDGEARAAFLIDLLELETPAQLGKASEVMRPLRIRKDAHELHALRESAAVVDAVIPRAREACRPGRTEREIADDIYRALAAEKPGFQPAFNIVASGPNSALPHHDTSDRALQNGDVVVLDYGGFLEGYISDITVTVGLQPEDPEVHRVYRTVWEAQQRALEAIRPGVACDEVDRAARGHIEAAGYGDYFLHRTGHGVGLQCHEPPDMVAGHTLPLEEGMCFSIEPGIYLPDRFGIRLEVLVTVTSDGVELLNVPRAEHLPQVG